MTPAAPSAPAAATVSWDRVDSPVGGVLVAWTVRGVSHVHFEGSGGEDWPDTLRAFHGADCALRRDAGAVAARQLGEYVAGARRAFTLPLDLRGTPFQLAVWLKLMTIPYGKTAGYADVARMVGRPRAARAVGAANHANRIAIIVPCHRVVAAGGGLGGYGGGLERKRWLIELERHNA